MAGELDETTTGATAVAEAPAAPSSSAPAAPPSTSSATPAERPTSFAEAMARVGTTATPNPGAPKPVESTPVAATAQPPQTETPPVETVPGTENKGPIPFDRHESALKNARSKTEQEVTQRFQQQYGEHVQFGEKFKAAPVETAISVIAELSNHPEHGPAMVSALARALGQRRGQTPPATNTVAEQEPQADLQTPDGLRVYSAEQQARRETWLKQQWMQEIDQRLQPLQAREQQLLASERETHAMREATTRMQKVVEPFAAQPEFQANKSAIVKRQQELFAAGHDPQTALGLAYTQILREVVMPARTAKTQEQLVAEAVKKATGSTSTPSAAPAAPATRPKDFASAFGRVNF